MPDTPIMDTVYFYKFNNYYNRIIKRYDTIAEYGDPIATQTNCNFVHGDGVNASFTLNKGTALLDTPDYCVVLDYNSNISRWFVINSFKSRNGQDVLTLRRDLIADFYADVINYSPCLIRKGYVPNTNPLVFQDEGVQYNKIKTEEIMIKDESNCSYIVGFISNNASAQATVTGLIKDDNYDYYYGTLADFPFKSYVEGAGNTHTNSKRRILNNAPNTRLYFSLKFSGKTSFASGTKENMEMIMRAYDTTKPSYYTPIYSTTIRNGLYVESGYTNNVRLKCSKYVDIPSGQDTLEIQTLQNTYPNQLWTNMNFSYLDNEGEKAIKVSTDIEDILQYNGKRIKIGGTVYKVSLAFENTTNRIVTYNSYDPIISSSFANIIAHINNNKPTNSQLSNNAFDISYDGSYTDYTESDLKVMATTEDVYLLFTEAQATVTTSVDSASNRTHLQDQPYDMFMLINETGVSYKVGTDDYVSDHEINMSIAQAICQSYGSASYDIQIVPFNPIQGSILADGTLNFYDYDTHPIKNANNDVVGHYVLCSSADLKLTLNKDELKFNPTDYKKDYNLKQYRLCSPNQETIFEFSPSMNGGIETWEVTANYRPYSSYIKVQPTWNWLYGVAEYGLLTDFRGLVYNSSLCISQLNDAYATYVSNNKNYQQLFDNQINTLTKSQDIQINALEETLGLRAYTGMPISSILRTIGGSKDIDMQRELNNVALTKMRTDFNYQMDNIKSMPHTIKKLTAINGDTRIFPFIEIYEATSVEQQSFEYKMQYTGMTVMTTGNINDYCKPNEETFIQASLIRLNLVVSEESANNQIAVEIASELDKGIYITKEE